MGRRIGIIAGSGELPDCILEETQKQGFMRVLAGIKGEAETALQDKADVYEWFDVDGIFNIIAFFKSNGVKDVIFAGKIEHRTIYRKDEFNKPFRELMANGKDSSPTAIIKTAIHFLAGQGIVVQDPTPFILSAFCDEGVLTETTPSLRIKEDIGFGWEIAKKLADLDIGQTVVVKDKAIVAVEGMEGTNEAIRRGGRLAGKGIVGIKVSRSTQDARIDLPAVGLGTVKSLVDAGGEALCIEARRVPFFQKEEAVALANGNNVSIIVKK